VEVSGSGWTILGEASLVDGVFSKPQGSDGWQDLYFDEAVIRKDTSYTVTLKALHEDGGGLVLGVFSKQSRSADCEYIASSV